MDLASELALINWTRLSDPLLIWTVSIAALFCIGMAIYYAKTNKKER